MYSLGTIASTPRAVIASLFPKGREGVMRLVVSERRERKHNSAQSYLSWLEENDITLRRVATVYNEGAYLDHTSPAPPPW